MVKKIFWLICLAAVFNQVNAQKFKKLPESKISVHSVEKHIRFLASDALLGRKTGEEGNNAAASYIAEEWRSYGVKPANGESFFQTIPFEKISQPEGAYLLSDGARLQVQDDFLVMSGEGVDLVNTEAVSVGYGWVSEDGSYDDFKDIDVKGKVIVAQMGTPDTKGFRAMFEASSAKEKIAREKGALAIIEIFSIPAPWEVVQSNFAERLTIDQASGNGLSRILVMPKTAQKLSGQFIDMHVGALVQKPVPSNNVVGIIEGSDPDLKKEYVILSAHYDHVGFREAKDASDDYIFNGARDNAMGVSAVLEAAKALSEKPAKRSFLLLAFTGEEMGLLGSKYYAEHPLIPLSQCVFNLNIDGAGYNDTSIITGIGVERTGAESEIRKAVEQMGLKLMPDPVPEQGLFDRSDNVSFAAKGIPAPSFSPGFTAFDEALMRFYHKEADEATTLDFAYCTTFDKAYVYAARLVANKAGAPRWVKGDKYEEAGKALYGY